MATTGHPNMTIVGMSIWTAVGLGKHVAVTAHVEEYLAIQQPQLTLEWNLLLARRRKYQPEEVAQL